MSREKFIFIGNIVTQGLKSYFRYQRPKEYKPLALYVDECQNFINFNLMDILKEGRKYKLSCVLSTQDMAVIDQQLARVMLNVGNLISFRAGHREAVLVANEMCIEPQILQFLEKYHVAYKTPSEKGIAKAPRPPIFKKIEVKVEPQRKADFWFPLESYQAT